MNAIIIWENVPEDTKIYTVEGVSDDDMKRLRLCHQHFGNLSGNSEEVNGALDWLSTILAHDWSHSRIYDSNVENASPLWAYSDNPSGRIAIIHTGFML